MDVLTKSSGYRPLKWWMLLILTPMFVVGCGLLGEQELTESLTPAPVQGNVRGYSEAKLTVFVWNDFQCPGCARWALGLEQNLIRRYVNTGKVRLIYRHYPVLGVESVVAAVASECAGDQNEFVSFREVLFQNQDGVDQGAFTPELLMDYAHNLVLDASSFDRCFQSGTYLPRVQGDLVEGRGIGVQNIPVLQIGTNLYGDLTDWEQLQQSIDEELSQRD